jgi:hypothetical protein
MSNATPLIVLAFIMAALIGGISYVAQRDRAVRGDAEKRIAEAARGAKRSTPNGEVVFRKRRLFGFLLILLFLLFLCIALFGLRFNLGAMNSAGRPFTGLSAGIGVLVSFVPLAMAIWQWKYRVRVSHKELAISTFTTRTVQLRDIGEVTIGAYRSSPYCQIRLNTGEGDLAVGSELKGFLDFVSLLSENVKKSKTLAGDSSD